MIHYSCDRCKCSINPDEELRYVVNLEVHAAMDSADAENSELDRDHLLEIHEILERIEEADSESIADDIYQQRRYDLCSDCYRAFVRNPIGAETSAHSLGFSQN